MKFNWQLTALGFIAGALIFTYQTKGEDNGNIDMNGLGVSGGVGTVASLILQQLAGGKNQSNPGSYDGRANHRRVYKRSR